MKEASPEKSKYKIELPRVGDELLLAPMHIQAWKESYIVPESGLTEEKIDKMLAHLLENTDYRKNIINESLTNPDEVLYRVVRKQDGGIVGFLHGSKHEAHNELDAIYLLNEAKGLGIGRELVEEFLSWSDKDKPCRLEVFTFNDSAINFYLKCGFQKTNKALPLFKDILPVTEMLRPVTGS